MAPRKKKNLLPLTPADPPKESQPVRKAVTSLQEARAQVEAASPEGQIISQSQTQAQDPKAAASENAIKVIRADLAALKKGERSLLISDHAIRLTVTEAGFEGNLLSPKTLRGLREEAGIEQSNQGWLYVGGNKISRSRAKGDPDWVNPEPRGKTGGKRRGRPPGSGRKASGDVATGSAGKIPRQSPAGDHELGAGLVLVGAIAELQKIMRQYNIAEMIIPADGAPVVRIVGKPDSRMFENPHRVTN